MKPIAVNEHGGVILRDIFIFVAQYGHLGRNMVGAAELSRHPITMFSGPPGQV